MSRYLVFATQAAANTAQGRVFTRLANALVARGLKYDPATGILGRVGTDASDAPATTQRTVRWATPAQRPDGKWVLLHPEEHQLAKRFPAIAAQLTQDIDAAVTAGTVTIEVFSAAWFSPVPFPKPGS